MLFSYLKKKNPCEGIIVKVRLTVWLELILGLQVDINNLAKSIVVSKFLIFRFLKKLEIEKTKISLIVWEKQPSYFL